MVDLEAIVEQADYLIAQFKYVAELTGELRRSVVEHVGGSNGRRRKKVDQMLLAAEQLNESAIDRLEGCLADDNLSPNFNEQLGDALHELGNQLNKVSMGCQWLLKRKDDLDATSVKRTQRLHRFCRGIAERMRLYAKQVGRRVTQSQAVVVAHHAPQPPTQDDEALHVAVVDDEAATAEAVAEHLTQANRFTVEIFRDGESLLRRMQECTFDAVLLDVVLPGMNGDQVLQTILDDSKLAATPVLMMSGIMDPSMVLGCLERGAVDYLPKPLELPVLDARIQACRNRKRLREMEYRQHFTSELAAELYCDPEKLEERTASISVLFCDIRRFSAITSRLTTSTVVGWIRDTMTELSKCVFESKGTLVDYAGDGLMAMWGAPVPQEDHASLALDAAFQMQMAVKRLAEQWEPVLGESLRLGIGINSGEAHVGVIGKFPKFKYGPLGPDVNVASRVEGTTKYFQVPLLVTGKTHQLLADRDDCVSRRLCDAQLVNITQAVPVFEFRRGGLKQTTDLFGRYSAALAHFEGSKFEAAAESLGTLFADHPNDGPTQVLLARTLDAMVTGKHEPVWLAPGK